MEYKRSLVLEMVSVCLMIIIIIRLYIAINELIGCTTIFKQALLYGVRYAPLSVMYGVRYDSV